MQWTYDSWNRLQNIIYPDGEQVNYYYNNGGLLNSMTSTKSGQNTTFISSIGYNKFEKREKITYGNQTYSEYTYDPASLRLSNLKTYDNLGSKLQDIFYTYDNVSNITQINNIAQPANIGMAEIMELGDIQTTPMMTFTGLLHQVVHGRIIQIMITASQWNIHYQAILPAKTNRPIP